MKISLSGPAYSHTRNEMALFPTRQFNKIS